MANVTDLILSNDTFLKGIHLKMEKEKHLGVEGVKLGFAVALLVSSLAALVLVPHFLQNHSWSQFLEGLKEAKWALIGGAIAGVALTLIGMLYLWQKNKEDKDTYVQQTLLQIDKYSISKSDHSNIQAIKKDLETRYRNLSVVIGIVALSLLATSLLVAKTENLISKITLIDFALGGALAIGAAGFAYMIFKSHQIHQIRKIRERCERNADEDNEETRSSIKEINFVYLANQK